MQPIDMSFFPSWVAPDLSRSDLVAEVFDLRQKVSSQAETIRQLQEEIDRLKEQLRV